MDLDRRLSPLIVLGTLMLAIAALYWGRPVLMPVALAILLTFLLNPLVEALHRRRLPRALAVLMVVFAVFTFLAGLAWSLGQQVSSLVEELPEYKDNVRQKVADFRQAGRGTALERMQGAIQELIGELRREDEEDQTVADQRDESAAPAEKPVPVVLHGDNAARRIVPAALGSIAELLAMAALVIVLVFFMLLRMQQLRNRLIRVIGYSRLTTTMKALDEAGARITRYLLMQTFINATYGLAIATGLFLIGLPYAMMWGTLAFFVRFIPYVGPWLGAILPVLFSFVFFDGWTQPLLVMGLFTVVELCSNMIMEPMLYGQSAGVSEVALLVALAFWTWVWGPIGLALATPLTVCLVVLCKYIPELEFVELIMGDEQVVDARLVFYQRLLAMDADEAAEVIADYLKQHPVADVFDEVLVPALILARRDTARKKLTDSDREFIYRTTSEVVGTMQVRDGEENAGVEPDDVLYVAGCAVHDEADEIALAMLARFLDPKRCQLEIFSSGMLSSEMVSRIRETNPAIICIGSIAPDPAGPIRYLCKRMRERFPGVRIVVGRWGARDGASAERDQLIAAGADYVGSSLVETSNQLAHLAQIVRSETAQSRAGRAPAA